MTATLPERPSAESTAKRKVSAIVTTAPQTQPPKRVSIKNLPINLFGSVMGLSGLSLAWNLAHKYFGADPAIGRAIGNVAVVVFLTLSTGYIVKFFKYPATVRAEFAHPITGNFFGTFTISLLLLSSVVSPYGELLAQTVWTLGTISTVLLSFVVATRLLKGRQDPAHAVPAWLIPGVATLDVAVAGAHMPMSWAYEVNMFAIAIGVVIALVFFTMIFARLVNHEALPAGMAPSLMIMIAPFEVGFLAYTNVAGHIDMFASLLFYFGLFMFITLSFKVFRKSNSFSASWWAISFPIAALSNAALKYAAAQNTVPLFVISGLILTFLTVAIAVLLIRTLHIAINGKLLAG